MMTLIKTHRIEFCILGYQVQEFFRRVACISYEMLVKQQLNPSDRSPTKMPMKTQLAVSFNSSQGILSQKQTNDNCCSA